MRLHNNRGKRKEQIIG